MQNTAVQFDENCDPIHIAAIQNLLDLYAFWAEKRSEKRLSIALANSNPVLTVWAPRLKKVERIYLMTTYQQGFYRQLGFRENTTTTMLKEQRVL